MTTIDLRSAVTATPAPHRPGHGEGGVSTALLTDHYELTMLQAALSGGLGGRRAVFEVFARRLPDGRRYGVVAGTGRMLDALADFRFGDEELAFLQEAGVVDDRTLEWLGGYRFTGDIWGYAEGECYFPGSPLLVVESTFAEAVLLETLLLSILNHDSAVAAAASRMTAAADGRPCIEMGSRRTHEAAAPAAARAAYVAGFATTSNLAAGRRYGIPTAGTSAHAYTLLSDDEETAFRTQVAALGTDTTLLVDTYDVTDGVRTAVEVAGDGLGAVRIDSGDLVLLAHQVRRQLDRLGATGTRIVVTSDLDEYAIASLASAPVDAYGVGTALVTGSGHPTAGLVYKMVARSAAEGAAAADIPVAKRSPGKIGSGGRKQAWRRLDADGVAVAEVVGPAPEGGHGPDGGGTRNGPRVAPQPGRPLLVPLVRDGEIVGREPLSAARERHERSRAELPISATQLSRGEPAIRTVHLAADGGTDPA